MTIKIGDSLPDATVRVMTKDGPAPKKLSEITAGRKVVIVGVPGAFTPTCHRNHMPGYAAHADAIKAKGVDEIMIIAVNDVFVMDAWAKASGAEAAISFVSDGNAEFAKACGLDADFSMAGMGVRSKRFSLLVDKGAVTQVNIEEGREVKASAAETILGQL